MIFKCENCIGMMEYGCYCDRMGAVQPGGPMPVPCPVCDGAGEWDEGPLPASSGATEPDYRQVICPECNGTGTGSVECEPMSLDDMDEAFGELSENSIQTSDSHPSIQQTEAQRLK